MANIRKRGNKYIYVHDDPNALWTTDPKTGKKKRKQIYESFDTEEEAQIFKAEFEVKMLKGKVISPSTETVADFIERWVKMYAPNNWQPTTYDSNYGMLINHVVPLIGQFRMQKVTPLLIENLITELRHKRCMGPKSYNKPENEIPFLSTTTVRTIYDLLKKIFDKAVEWKVIEENPVVCERPKKARSSRKAWTKNQVKLALENIDKPLLKLSVHTAFFCSLRNGEAMAITLDCIDFEDGKNGSITINKTLQRVSKKALKEIPPDELLFVFPSQKEDGKSVLILKEPKTEGSSRKVYLTRENRLLIQERLEQIQREKEFYDLDYHDFNLLFALPEGWPIEPKLNEKWFKKWQSKCELDIPEIVFHELRHTSITYKILVSGGDIKNVGLGAGQSSLQTTEGYNHGFDENQREIIRKVEEDFWGGKGFIDADRPLESGVSVSADLLQFMVEERLGKEVRPVFEFESVEDYVAYLLDALMWNNLRHPHTEAIPAHTARDLCVSIM